MFLLIDTSSKKTYLALFEGERLVEERLSEEMDQSSFLLPAIDSLLASHDTSIEKISFIAICVGPGTFTGTRIGVMTAKTLSYALSIPLIPFPSPREANLISSLLSQFEAKIFADPKTLDASYEKSV